MEYTANISEAAKRQTDWGVITSDLLLSDDTSDSSDDVQFTSASTGRQGRVEVQIHNEDHEAAPPPHDDNGDEANGDGPLATADPPPVAPVPQLATPAAPQMAPFNAGVSYS